MTKKFTKLELISYSILILIIAIAWMGILDKQAYELNLQSLRETSTTFVLIKSFDALITFAKNIPMIGNLISPYKDFLDRMSWVMLVSIMSLGLQKIIIIAMQSIFINMILTLNFVAIIVNKMLSIFSETWNKKLIKLMLVLMFIRFAIPFATFSIHSIETTAYTKQAQISKERIEKLQYELINIENMVKESKASKLEKEQHNKLLNDKIVLLKKEKQEHEREIKRLKENGHTELLDKVTSIFESLPEDTKKQIKLKEARIDQINIDMKSLKDEIDNSFSSTTFTNIKAKIKTLIVNLNSTMENMFDVFLTSVALFLFKNVIFPLLFIWALAKVVDGIFNTQFNYKLGNTVSEKITKIDVSDK